MSSRKYDGGYDYVFTEDVPDELICMICHLLVRDARQASCCGKIYCEQCLIRLAESTMYNQCPNCRQSLYYMIFKDTRANREVSDLKVYCANKTKGCEWQGVIRNVERHLQECPKEERNCPRCDETVRLDRMAEHSRAKCRKRNYCCPHCFKIGQFDLITGAHLVVCEKVVIDCPNKSCNVQVMRCQMQNHRASCPKEVLECRFVTVGCPIKRTREEMDDHIAAAVEEHLQYSVKKIKDLEERQVQKTTVLKLDGFSNYRSSGCFWYSPGFYTSAGGYKLQLLVCAQNSVLSCAVQPVPGNYDITLQWPFRGTVHVKLMNQLHDHSHLCGQLEFSDYHDSSTRYINFGAKNFVALSALQPTHCNGVQFLQADTLYFRVDVSVQSCTKPWLV